MKVYVVGKSEEQWRARDVQDALRNRGHTITYDWTEGVRAVESGATHTPESLTRQARLDFEGVAGADAVVVLHNSQLFGGMVEFGVALALGKPIYLVVGEGYFRNCIFFHMGPQVRHFRRVVDLLRALDADARSAVLEG